MGDIFIFFGEDVRVVKLACDMYNFDEIILNLFANCVFSDLYVADAFRCHIVGPLDTSGIVVVYDNGTVCEEFEKIEVF